MCCTRFIICIVKSSNEDVEGQFGNAYDKMCTAHTLQFLTRGFVVVVAHSLNCVQLLATPWSVADQTPLSTGCPRQGYQCRLPFSSRRSSQPRDRTHISCIARQILTTEPPGNPIRELTCNLSQIFSQHHRFLKSSFV